jgi:hypothetical protein
MAEATSVKTANHLAVQLLEQRHNLKEDLLEKSKLAQHACEEGHKVEWDEARILETDSNSKYRKYKKLANMACLTNPVWTFPLSGSPLSAMRLPNSQRRSV